jgi:RimJ/RimL family protein N-acetyltransferase
MNYIFTSKRLGFRNWQTSDIPKMTAISSNPNVMRFFPSTQDETVTSGFLNRMKIECETKGFCYFAVDKLENGEFIGFIGLSEPSYESPFTPCVDIGWRLAEAAWNQGFATEGAKRCLEFAFENLQLKTVKAFAPEINLNSINVMQKIGMTKIGTFKHPRLKDFERLETCVCFEIDRNPEEKSGQATEDSLPRNLVG